MTGPEVSVVVPTHDRAGFVGAAVLSALGQTWRDLEVVVVDDASQDGTAEVVAQLTDPRLRVLTLPDNVGASRARNRGVAAARGRYVAFLDSDDTWTPDKLARQLALLRRRGTAVAACGFVVSDGRRRRTAVPRRAAAGDVGAVLSPRQEPLISSCLVLDREAVGPDLYFDEDLAVLEDLDVVCRAVAHGALVVDRRIGVHKGIGPWRRAYDPDGAAEARDVLVARHAPAVPSSSATYHAVLAFLRSGDPTSLELLDRTGRLSGPERSAWHRLDGPARRTALAACARLRSASWSRSRRRAADLLGSGPVRRGAHGPG